MLQPAAVRLLFSFLILFSALGTSSALAGPNDVAALVESLDRLDKWIGSEANGDKWRKYLYSRALRAQIEKGNEADPAVLSRVLEQYRSGASGLDQKLFVDVANEIAAWRNSLIAQYSDKLPKLAWASRGDYQPASQQERLSPSQNKLKHKARSLERSLGTDTPFAQNWKRYLRWDRLEPHLSGEGNADKKSLVDLTSVLRRFRSNADGLERPEFTQTAEALESYRAILQWYQQVNEVGQRSRRKYSPKDLERRVYMMQLLELEKQLTRHLEAPTIETSRKIGQLMGLVDRLEQSPQLVSAMRSNFTQPNVFTEVAESAINRLAERPVNDTQPVRDCILGARILGTANSTGFVSLRTLPADDHIALELQLSGMISSRTVGHKKPVRISSRSNTTFAATKSLQISEESFHAQPAVASANTNSKTLSVRKTGGNFGRRLIEKIAWKKVGESKRQSERIASRKAEKRVADKFDEQVAEAMHTARGKYEEKGRPPLVRLGVFPDHLQLGSTADSINVEARLASYEQLSASTPPIEMVDHDLSLKVHESVANNFLPSILAGVGIKQETESEPPKLLGDFPPWLKELADKHVGKKQEESSEGSEETAKEEFKPFSVTLNDTHPISLRLDDQKISIRIRIAELISVENGEEKIREDWDFLVTFEIVQRDNGVVLKRVGDVEAFPTGFDPNPLWGDKLSGEQAATRGVLAKVLKKRADSENGLPSEIEIPPFEFTTADGVTYELELQHLDCDDGWMTLGYRLP